MLYNGVSKYQSSFALISKTGVKSKGLIRTVYSDPRFKVLSDSLFKGVCFPLEANRLHPFEGVSDPVVAVAPEAEEESIGTKFDVVAHHARVHSNQFNGRGSSGSSPPHFFLIWRETQNSKSEKRKEK